MATEGPLIHDGSQTTANSNLSGPAATNPGGTGSTLAGQNGSGQFLIVKLVGARLVDLVTANSDTVYGVLQNKPAAGQAADNGISGITKLMAGGTIAAGAAVMPATTGVAVTATGTYGFAVAIEAAVTGDIFTARLQNIN
jgi:hypothetical protein